MMPLRNSEQDRHRQSLLLSVTDQREDAVRIEVHGPLTRESLIYCAPLGEWLDGATSGKLVTLDLSGCEAIDSTGVSWLLEMHQLCQRSGGRLVLEAVSELVRTTLELLNLDHVLQIAAAARPPEGRIHPPTDK